MRRKSGWIFILLFTAGLLAQVASADWESETVDAVGNVGQYPSIAVSAAGDVFIAYYDQTEGDLKYAFRNETQWTVQIVDADGDVGAHTAIALDGYPAPHVIYRDNTNDYVKYAYSDNTSWANDVFWPMDVLLNPLRDRLADR